MEKVTEPQFSIANYVIGVVWLSYISVCTGRLVYSKRVIADVDSSQALLRRIFTVYRNQGNSQRKRTIASQINRQADHVTTVVKFPRAVRSTPKSHASTRCSPGTWQLVAPARKRLLFCWYMAINWIESTIRNQRQWFDRPAIAKQVSRWKMRIS